MTIEFGSIKRYNPDRGFGFVSRTFFYPHREVFFHIKKIKKKDPELAKKLDNSETFETVNFWYKIEKTKKGEQVNQIWLSVDNIPQSHQLEISGLIKKVESLWKNIDSPKPSWLDLVTIELVGVDRKIELSTERNNLESQRKAAEEEQRRAAEAAREKERQEAERQEQKTREEVRRLAWQRNLEERQAEELYQLLTEMRPKNFKRSKELSNYIVKHQLGYKYKNISGILGMKEGDREWDFHGGFPTWIYRIICDELGLVNEGTPARPTTFRPFKDVL